MRRKRFERIYNQFGSREIYFPRFAGLSMVQWICELGGANGKVTRFFFLKELEILLHAHQFEAFQKEKNLPKEQYDAAVQLII
jgi:hypothetical protein